VRGCLLCRRPVLLDGPPALSHPTNEDLFVGTPIRRSLRDLCALSSCVRTVLVLPLVGAKT
jgi:hypothetical protein